MSKILNCLFVSSIVLMLSACGGGGGGSTGTDSTKVNFSGKIQKGPYKAGTTVTIQELDDKLQQTGKSYTTTTKNDKGDYEFSGTLATTIVEIYANGFYFDEIAGKLSSAKLSVGIIVDLNGKNKVNINILSSLVSPRIKELVSEGKSFTEAKQEAESDLLKFFKIDDKDVNFESFDLSSTDEKAKVLLAITSQLLQAATTNAGAGSATGELQGIIANLGDDLKDGTVDGAVLKETLVQAGKDVDASQVQDNLRDNFNYDVPEFADYIDEDDDGTVALNDNETTSPFSFDTIDEVKPNSIIKSNAIAISGLDEGSISKLSIENSLASIIKNGVRVVDKFTYVGNGDIIEIELLSKSDKSSASTEITVGEFTTTFTVTPDVTKPVITMLGSNISLELGTAYTDAGATATDNIDGDITSSIAVTSNTDVFTVGTYTAKYDVNDATGNEADTVMRMVTITADVTKPTITILGSNVSHELGTAYTDAGATAADNIDGDISENIIIVSNVDTSKEGTYTLTYNVLDSASNRAMEIIRTVIVEDTKTPDSFSFDTLDDVEPDSIIKSNEIIISGLKTDAISKLTIDNNAATIVKNGERILGNFAYVSNGDKIEIELMSNYSQASTETKASIGEFNTIFKINLKEIAPVITLIGDNNISIEFNGTNEAYEDVGARASDNLDGDISENIIIVSNVDTSKVGTYTVTYNVLDSASNRAIEIIRTVTVEDKITVSLSELVAKGSVINKVEIGPYHKCALIDSGDVYCWGDNYEGYLGNGNTSDERTKNLQKVIDITNVVDISLGVYSTCALTDIGKVYCWGGGSHGQLARMPNTDNSATPIEISLGSKATSISQGGTRVCATLVSGSMKCWGGNSEMWEVTNAELGGKAISSSGGGTHTCALLDDGNVRCIGWNNGSGELGDLNVTTHSSTSRKIGSPDLGGRKVQKVSAGAYFSCALMEDGSVECWGDNKYGQLGNAETRHISQEDTFDPTNPIFPKPTQVIGLDASTTVDIYSGWSHTCVILVDGSVECWGINSYGQLGATTTEEIDEGHGIGEKIKISSTPIRVNSFSREGKSITASYYNSCVLSREGKLECWGQ